MIIEILCIITTISMLVARLAGCEALTTGVILSPIIGYSIAYLMLYMLYMAHKLMQAKRENNDD